MEITLSAVKAEALKGNPCSVDDALSIAAAYPLNDICDAADDIRKALTGDNIDTCSIINARSGKCSEDCKWCAQSARHHTGCDEYDMVPEETLNRIITVSNEKGVRRLSLVTSGRKVAPADIDRYCSTYRYIRSKSPIFLCASMGLLSRSELQKLRDAGVRRYHCNLETSASFFPNLCSTHTHADKLRTISAAREVGMEVCSGGIIGMGETLGQRLEMIAEAREAGATSIPVNILNPIKGTPLQNTPPLSEEEIILTIALARLVAPEATIRFAGGRASLSPEATERILHGGLNGALVGNMLTTVGNDIDSDRNIFEKCGFVWQ